MNPFNVCNVSSVMIDFREHDWSTKEAQRGNFANAGRK